MSILDVEKNRVRLFLVKFFGIFLILYVLVLLAPIGILENWIAGFEAGILGLETAGNAVFINGDVFVITESCTGLVSGIILFAIIFSLGKPNLRRKILLFISGLAILMLVNLARIYLVLSAGIEFGAEYAGILHTATWFLTAAVILGVWYYLTKKTVKVKKFSELL